MSHADLFTPLTLARGPEWKNRIALAPLTNQQSNEDGTLDDAELHWLTMRAKGGFGHVMTCATYVQASGKGFSGQLGIFGDQHLPGLTRMADTLRDAGTVSAVQLHHAGMRALSEQVGPSGDEEQGIRELTRGEVEQLRDDFIAAAKRADTAGFDGIELHGAHGYILSAFLSIELNRRTDSYGGSPENRRRLIDEILTGIRQSCRSDFQVGLRLSPERFGLDFGETLHAAEHFMTGGNIDYLDMSLWDFGKEPNDEAYRGKQLIEWFSGLKRGPTRLGAAGNVRSGLDAINAMKGGADYVLIGRAAIVAHDWPMRLAKDPGYKPAFPATPAELAEQGVTPVFLDYLKSIMGDLIA